MDDKFCRAEMRGGHALRYPDLEGCALPANDRPGQGQASGITCLEREGVCGARCFQMREPGIG